MGKRKLVASDPNLVKDNYELHQDNSRHPEFIPVSHVRDQLLPPKQRQKLRPRWEKAVKFIEANESRIRIESQSVQGEEFLVWRWLPVSYLSLSLSLSLSLCLSLSFLLM
uniref:LEM domain-containing protein 2 n=1 Tax=Magallana gigas TaxID=29159 RepID=K1PDW8_MAGGI